MVLQNVELQQQKQKHFTGQTASNYKDKTRIFSSDVNLKVPVISVFLHPNGKAFKRVFALLLHLQVINALSSLESKWRQKESCVSAGFYFYSLCCQPLPCFVLLPQPDAIGELCSTDGESPCLFSLFEGRQRWIDIDGFRRRRWFSKLGTCPTFSTVSTLQTEWDAAAVLMTISTKSLTVKPLFSLPLSFLFLDLEFYFAQRWKDSKPLSF